LIVTCNNTTKPHNLPRRSDHPGHYRRNSPVPLFLLPERGGSIRECRVIGVAFR
jgi:hypothetical protein